MMPALESTRRAAPADPVDLVRRTLVRRAARWRTLREAAVCAGVLVAVVAGGWAMMAANGDAATLIARCLP